MIDCSRTPPFSDYDCDAQSPHYPLESGVQNGARSIQRSRS